MAKPRVGVVGASGYSGMVLTSILSRHAEVDLVFASSDKWTGDRVDGRIGARSSLTFVGNDVAPGLEADLVFLATAAEVSLRLAPPLVASGRKVIDLSGAFRLKDATKYPRFYAFEHHEPELLRRAHYGLPERFGAPSGKLVANPGCYPTATILALAPLLDAGLVAAEGLIVDAKSGVTGAGRKATEDYSFAEIDTNIRAYKLHTHQHTPEIAQALGVAAMTFTPHLLPVRRGILSTCYARSTASAADLRRCLEAAYERSPFVKVMEPERVGLVGVVGTNECHLGVAANGDTAIVVSSIDNLVKGAAGQATQNMNSMLGFPETLGLSDLPRSAP